MKEIGGNKALSREVSPNEPKIRTSILKNKTENVNKQTITNASGKKVTLKKEDVIQEIREVTREDEYENNNNSKVKDDHKRSNEQNSKTNSASLQNSIIKSKDKLIPNKEFAEHNENMETNSREKIINYAKRNSITKHKTRFMFAKGLLAKSIPELFAPEKHEEKPQQYYSSDEEEFLNDIKQSVDVKKKKSTLSRNFFKNMMVRNKRIEDLENDKENNNAFGDKKSNIILGGIGLRINNDQEKEKINDILMTEELNMMNDENNKKDFDDEKIDSKFILGNKHSILTKFITKKRNNKQNTSTSYFKALENKANAANISESLLGNNTTADLKNLTKKVDFT